MKHLFWKTYLVFVVVLAILSGMFCHHVTIILQEYELSQPEVLIEKQISSIKQSAENGTLSEIVPFQSLNQVVYDKPMDVFSDYQSNIANAEHLSYKIMTGGFDETGLTYQIVADNEPIATINLKSSHEETKLAILKVNDWSIASINPIMTLMNYNYTIQTPNNSKVFVNGYEINDHIPSEKEGWELYQLNTLYSEPDIRIYDEYGCETEYDIVDNLITPIIHEYSLTLPNSYRVYVNDTILSGIEKEHQTAYSILTASEELKIMDEYNNVKLYDGTGEIYAYDYEFELPSNYTIFLGDKDLTPEVSIQKEYPKYQYLTEYTDTIKQNTYIFEDSLYDMEFYIYDNLGNPVDYVLNNGTLKITEQAGLEEIPEYITNEIDVLDVAKQWSLFMTDDLKGDTNGFAAIKKYLIKDSYMYNMAYKWATGIDITLTSGHRTSDNYFTDEKVTNFIQYSDNLFSCDISFVKYMYLYKRKSWVDDPMNSTFYFMKYGAGPDAHLVILDIQEIIK